MEYEYLETIQDLNQHDKKGLLASFFKHVRKSLRLSRPYLFAQFLALEEIDQRVREAIIRLNRIQYQLRANELCQRNGSRRSLQAYADSLTARSEYYQEKYYTQVNFDNVLEAVPFWFTALSNLHKLLPMRHEMFDLVIFDEATQCNLSVCLPVLQRAKRAVVVGDQKQLKHVSFVSYDLQHSLAQEYELNPVEVSDDFRNLSMLDYALRACKSAYQSVSLDEHFRSHPQIIEFSNREFYQSSLKIMTRRPGDRRHSVLLTQVNGKFGKKGVNVIEAEALLLKLKAIIHEQSQLRETEVHSLGVLAFFSSQAAYLEKQVFDEIGVSDMRRHNLRVGTPFSFQGEERDHMLISCSVDASTSGGSYTYLNRDDVFNVAVTRARNYQTVFTSCDAEQMRVGSKLASYLKFIFAYGDLQGEEEVKKPIDRFQAEVCERLGKLGIDTYKNYSVVGTNIDIIGVYHGRAIALDLVGFESELKGVLSLKQFKLLKRAGLDSFLLSYQEWQEHPDELINALMLKMGVLIEPPELSDNEIDHFDDSIEAVFEKITGGISVNKLHVRFKRNNELLASQQLRGLVRRRIQFIEILGNHFSTQEITYTRYLNTLDDILKFCISNLQQASVATELAGSLFEQQKLLFGPINDEHEFDDVIAVRLDMIDEQRHKFKRLITTNEKALLQIDKTIIKLTELEQKVSVTDPIKALEELTTRLDLYRGIT